MTKSSVKTMKTYADRPCDVCGRPWTLGASTNVKGRDTAFCEECAKQIWRAIKRGRKTPKGTMPKKKTAA